eukprot:jgi/Hompol1/6550/HPOL_000217-RA
MLGTSEAVPEPPAYAAAHEPIDELPSFESLGLSHSTACISLKAAKPPSPFTLVGRELMRGINLSPLITILHGPTSLISVVRAAAVAGWPKPIERESPTTTIPFQIELSPNGLATAEGTVWNTELSLTLIRFMAIDGWRLVSALNVTKNTQKDALFFERVGPSGPTLSSDIFAVSSARANLIRLQGVDLEGTKKRAGGGIFGMFSRSTAASASASNRSEAAGITAVRQAIKNALGDRGLVSEGSFTSRAYEFKMNHSVWGLNPINGANDGYDAHLVIASIIKEAARLGYALYGFVDLTAASYDLYSTTIRNTADEDGDPDNKVASTDTWLFQAVDSNTLMNSGPQPSSAGELDLATINLRNSTLLRIVLDGGSTDVLAGVQDAITKAWPPGTTSSTAIRSSLGSHEMHLANEPWTTRVSSQNSQRRLLLQIFTSLANRGWSLVSSFIATNYLDNYGLMFKRSNPDPNALFAALMLAGDNCLRLIQSSKVGREALSSVIDQSIYTHFRRVYQRSFPEPDVIQWELPEMIFSPNSIVTKASLHRFFSKLFYELSKIGYHVVTGVDLTSTTAVECDTIILRLE